MRQVLRRLAVMNTIVTVSLLTSRPTVFTAAHVFSWISDLGSRCQGLLSCRGGVMNSVKLESWNPSSDPRHLAPRGAASQVPGSTWLLFSKGARHPELENVPKMPVAASLRTGRTRTVGSIGAYGLGAEEVVFTFISYAAVIIIRIPVSQLHRAYCWDPI